MKGLFYLLILLFGFNAMAQSYVSKAFLLNGQFLKTDTTIHITDSTITVNDGKHDYEYHIFNNVMDNMYETEYGTLNVRFMVSDDIPGRVKGFKYTHIIVLTSDNPDVFPEITYYCKAVQ